MSFSFYRMMKTKWYLKNWQTTVLIPPRPSPPPSTTQIHTSHVIPLRLMDSQEVLTTLLSLTELFKCYNSLHGFDASGKHCQDIRYRKNNTIFLCYSFRCYVLIAWSEHCLNHWLTFLIGLKKQKSTFHVSRNCFPVEISSAQAVW